MFLYFICFVSGPNLFRIGVNLWLYCGLIKRRIWTRKSCEFGDKLRWNLKEHLMNLSMDIEEELY